MASLDLSPNALNLFDRPVSHDGVSTDPAVSRRVPIPSERVSFSPVAASERDSRIPDVLPERDDVTEKKDSEAESKASEAVSCTVVIHPDVC